MSMESEKVFFKTSKMGLSVYKVQNTTINYIFIYEQ